MARSIKPALITIIDNKLKDNGSVQKAIKDKDARSLLNYAVEACVGEMEEGKDNHGTFVELCQRTVDNTSVGEAWCMSFVQSMIAYVEITLKVTSGIPTGDNCLRIWEKSPDELIVNNYPLRGAIVIWRHGKSSRELSTTKANGKKQYKGKGHTGFIVEYDNRQSEKNMITIEGNTKRIAVANRDGVFKKSRNKIKETGKDDLEVVGFLKPFPKTNF